MAEETIYSENFEILGNDFEHGGDVSARIKSTLKELGISSDVIRRLSIANFEAEMNVIMYADKAELTFSLTDTQVSVQIKDEGQGIPDIEMAMQTGYSTATPEMRARGFGAGMGLPNIKRNTDRFDIQSTVGVGTTLNYSITLNQQAKNF